MAFTVVECVRLVGKEFDDVPEEDIVKLGELFKPLVSKRKFGESYELALAYLICHNLKMLGYGDNAAASIGGAGSISSGFNIASISDGGSSISFASTGQSNLTPDAEYSLTSYGTQFLQLRKMFIVPITIAGGYYD